MEIKRESIFVSALRGFCRSLFVVLGVFAALFIAVFLFGAFFSSPYKSQEKTSLEILPDLRWKRDLAPLSAPVVLQIDIHGIIGDPENLNTSTIQSILLDSREGLLLNDRVKAVLLHFDTPGGTVVDSDNIYRLLLEYKKRFHTPVFGYVDGLCASGGMYIASAADRLFCGPAGIVGSVGIVSGPFFNVYDAITKLGVFSKTLTEGLDKDMMNPLRQWKPDEDAVMKAVIAHMYQQFVGVVTQARPLLDKTRLVQEYGAKIFDGPVAQQYGYVDVADSSYSEAVLSLLKEANIHPDKPYQIVTLHPRKSILAELVKGQSPLFHGKVEHRLKIGQESSFAIKDPFAYLYSPNG